jgi:hypothetical protein
VADAGQVVELVVVEEVVAVGLAEAMGALRRIRLADRPVEE